jgi:hypothetical protein
MEVYIWENLGKYRKSMEIPKKKEVFFAKSWNSSGNSQARHV